MARYVINSSLNSYWFSSFILMIFQNLSLQVDTAINLSAFGPVHEKLATPSLIFHKSSQETRRSSPSKSAAARTWNSLCFHFFNSKPVAPQPAQRLVFNHLTTLAPEVLVLKPRPEHQEMGELYIGPDLAFILCTYMACHGIATCMAWISADWQGVMTWWKGKILPWKTATGR